MLRFLAWFGSCCRRDLIFVWALGAAGLIAANSQVFTRLYIANFHWAWVWGPAFEYFLVVAVATEIGSCVRWSPLAHAALGTLAFVALALGLWIRTVETTRSVVPVHNGRALAAYRVEFPTGHVPKFAPNAVAAGDSFFVDLAVILDNLRPLDGWAVFQSPTVSKDELDDRVALNDVLLGFDRAHFEARQRAFFKRTYPRVGPWYRNPSMVPGLIAARLSAYDRAVADLPAALNHFAVRYVGIPTGSRPPYLTQTWTLVATGSTWDVWERLDAVGLASARVGDSPLSENRHGRDLDPIE